MFVNDYLTLGMVRLVGADKWQPEADGFIFAFFRGGTGKLLQDAACYRVTQGDVLLLNGKAGGKIGTSSADELLFSHFSLRIEQMYPLFSVSEISLLRNFADVLQSFKLYHCGNPAAVECHRLIGSVPPQFNLEHRTHLLRVVATILTEEFKSLQSGRPGFVSMEEHLIQVFEKLSANDLLTLSAGELAARFGCSRRHLNRLFHQHFGFSVAALRMELRMLRAVSLLQDTDTKVINVAEQCGFNHLGLFNTCFKRRFGTSPGQWRTITLKNPGSAPETGGQPSGCPFESNGLCPMLGGRKLLRPPPSQGLQLRTAALSAVLTRPGELKEAPRPECAPPVRLVVAPEPKEPPNLRACA